MVLTKKKKEKERVVPTLIREEAKGRMRRMLEWEKVLKWLTTCNRLSVSRLCRYAPVFKGSHKIRRLSYP